MRGYLNEPLWLYEAGTGEQALVVNSTGTLIAPPPPPCKPCVDRGGKGGAVCGSLKEPFRISESGTG